MQPESYLKGPCENCGAHIEFPAEALGQSIPCPHCGWNTKLVRAGALAVEASETPVVSHSKKRPSGLLIAVACFGLLVAMGFGIFAARKNAPSVQPEKIVSEKKVEEIALETTSSETSSTKKHPNRRIKKAATPEFESNGLQAFRIALEKSSNSRLIYATGVMRNQSNRQRFGVKVDLNLFDEQGSKIGSATDYTQVIEPHKEWKFRAMVTEPKAASAKVVSITEE